MQRVTSTDGTPIAVDRTGGGQPLVLVHGTTADRTRWAPVRPHLDEYFTVYAMDRRGRGDSGDTNDYHLDREVGDVVAVVESIGEPVVLLGHSFGALVALEAALATDAVDRLVLYEPAFAVGEHELYRPTVVADIAARIESGDNEGAVERFFLDIAMFSDAELDALRSAPNWPTRVSLAPTVLRETEAEHGYSFGPARFETLDTPTLLLMGSESPAMLRDATTALDEALPDSHLVVFHGHGHVVQNTAPEAFVEAVVRFCGSAVDPAD